MNLFILDHDPVFAAEQNCDSHVCKIILEAADCLAIAHWVTFGMPPNAPDILVTPRQTTTKSGKTKTIIPYFPQSHVNNHVTVWVRRAIHNYRWTVHHGLALCDEYRRRYSRTHNTEYVLQWLLENEPNLPNGSTPFRQAVARDPVDCVREHDVVLAYRLYYVYYKSRFARWRIGQPPGWYAAMLNAVSQNRPIEEVEALAT